MGDKQELEQDEIDGTEEKAKAIGKELGVEEDKSEDIVEYDIQEEPDERIAKERDPEKKAEKQERTQLSNKQKRDMRKKRINEKFNEKDAIIRAQQEQIEQLAKWKNEVDGRLSGINKSEVEKAWNDTVTAFTQAEKDHADAFNDGDGAKATAAMRVMYDAQRRIEQLQAAKAHLERQPDQPSNIPQNDPVIVNKAKSWAERNSWYNPNGRDVDSEIAKAISGVLANEGYDPKSDDFWDELDDRLSERLPEKYSADEQEEEDEPVVKKPKKRSAPPVGSGNARGDINGKKTITLPTSYINTLKREGIWDDKPRLAKILKDRERVLKESGN